LDLAVVFASFVSLIFGYHDPFWVIWESYGALF
jgi:hypothetical protein